MTYRDALRQWERQFFSLLMLEHEGRVQDIAKACGLNRTHLYRILERLELVELRPLRVLSEKNLDRRTRRDNKGNDAWQQLGR